MTAPRSSLFTGSSNPFAGVNAVTSFVIKSLKGDAPIFRAVRVKNPLPLFDCRKYVIPTDVNVVTMLISNVNVPPAAMVIDGRPPLKMVAVAFCADALSLARSGTRARATTRTRRFNFEFVFIVFSIWFGLWLVFLRGSVIDVNIIFISFFNFFSYGTVCPELAFT
jgi:hypothetical protein